MNQHARRTALVVDDDPAILRLLKLVLESDGMKICAAVNGQDALEKLDQCQPDVIVLDIEMPVMDGPTFLHTIRNEGCAVPVLVISARGAAAPKGLQADAYLAKPFAPDQLATQVRRLVA